MIDPAKVNSDQVLFGATVTIRDEDEALKTYSIVGIDETDLEKGRISWIAPIATALLKSRLGDFVEFRTPRGMREVEVVRIEYKPLD